MSRPAASLPLLLVVAVLLSAGAAVARGRDPAAAEALFRAGRDALKQGDWATACAKLAESQTLDPAGGTALNLAVCEEKQGHVASAWQRLREAIDSLPAGDDRIPLAQRQVAALERRVPHVTVRLPPDAPHGVHVVRDDVEEVETLLGFAQPVDPGAHVVRVSAPGFAARAYPFEAREGTTTDLIVEPGPPLPRTSNPAGRRVAGLVALGAGGSALVVGAVTGLTVIARGNERQRLCPGDVCATPSALDNARSVDSTGKALSAISTTAFAVGGAGMAAGIVLLLTARGSSVELSPAVGPGAMGMWAAGSF